MVKKESPVYLLVGQDSHSTDKIIAKIKQDSLPKQLEDFNLDRLYAKDLNLEDLQERLLCLPFKSRKRIIIIRNAQQLTSNIKKFLTGYVQHPQKEVILILQMDKSDPKDDFANSIARFATSFIKEEPRLDTFILSRQIELKKASYALQILHRLLKKGERPERILGGLRYSWEARSGDSLETRKRLKALLTCDLDIKTGRLKADFALEKLVIYLCCFR